MAPAVQAVAELFLYCRFQARLADLRPWEAALAEAADGAESVIGSGDDAVEHRCPGAAGEGTPAWLLTPWAEGAQREVRFAADAAGCLPTSAVSPATPHVCGGGSRMKKEANYGDCEAVAARESYAGLCPFPTIPRS